VNSFYRRRLVRAFLVVLSTATLLAALAFLDRRSDEGLQAQLVARPDSASAAPAEGFTRAEGPQPFTFPEDHGPHPDFQTEWWYYTGNLETESGRHFGYQLTFFRRALLPPDQRVERSSDWATDQVYLAHFTLTDVSAGRFQAFERFARGAAGIAGAQSPPYRVWLQDWSVEQVDAGAGQLGVYRLRAAEQRVSLDLLLTDTKGPVLQGERGYSRKGPEPGNASYYISQTRLATEGTVRVGGESFAVSGLSWMDHEFSTSALSQGQVGWDWFALQLIDGRELMVFHIRREDGSADPFSSGTLILQDGSTQHLQREDFRIVPQGTWRSPHTRADYPSGWRVTIPSAGLELEIEPYLADQELNVSYSYWEGAVRISGQSVEGPVEGNGYVELTGYAGSLAGEF
jgi:predicted secreted hydrolase